ncbi:MAG: phage baseplate assembly protein V [Bryobacteraceae bacterium]
MSLLLHDAVMQMLGPALFLAKVVSVQDPDSRNRVQVRLYNADGVAGQDGPIWARVAVPFAGGNRGAFFIPDVDDEVVVAFLGGDPRGAIVLGSLWNGHDTAPVSIGGSGKSVDRWVITGKAGTTIAIIEQPASSATITLSTPGGLTGTLTDQDGSIQFSNSSQTSVRIDSSGVTINAPTAQVQITGADQVSVTAPTVNVSAAASIFSGMVQCQVLQATSVVSTSYSLGAGNVW